MKNLPKDNLFENGEKGFYFHKAEWKSTVICFKTEKKNDPYDFFWGITIYSKECLNFKLRKLDCLNQTPTEWWPYGWEYLNKYRNWDMNTMTDMVNGKYMNYIEKLVLEAINEIETKQLPML